MQLIKRQWRDAEGIVNGITGAGGGGGVRAVGEGGACSRGVWPGCACLWEGTVRMEDWGGEDRQGMARKRAGRKALVNVLCGRMIVGGDLLPED